MKITRLYFLVAMLLLANLTIHAQKIGYIDYELFLSTLPAVKKVQTDIETLQADYQARGEKMVKAYQEKLITYQKMETDLHSPKHLREEIEKLKIEEQKIVDFEKEVQETVAKKSNEWMQPIHQKVQQAIRAIAKENDYLIIFNSQESISNSRFFSHKNEGDDITLLLRTQLEE